MTDITRNATVLAAADVRIIGHAINWLLNVPFDSTPQPSISPEEYGMLSRIFEVLVEVISKELPFVKFTRVSSGDVRLDGTILHSPSGHLQLMHVALRLFAQELAHAPAEIAIITGRPAPQLFRLRRRLGLLVYQDETAREPTK